MSLEALREEFLKQVEQKGEVAISEAILKKVQLTPTEGFDPTIKSYLKIDPAFPLTIRTQNIPTPQGQKLTFVEKSSFLNLQDIDIVEIEFSINENNVVDLLISVTLNKNWKFSDSFTFLSGYPFDEFSEELTLIDSHFLLTTRKEHNYTWKGHELTLQQGLNFVGYLQLRASLGILRNFLPEQNPDDKIVFSGTIDPTRTLIDPNIIIPDLNLIGKIDKEVVGIPNFSLSNPTINLKIGRDSRNNQFIWLYFIVTLTSAGLPDFEFKTPILRDSPNLGFAIEPKEGAVTPENIINLIGGEDFTEAIPDVLKGVFSAIGLKGLTLSLFVRLPKIKVINMSVSIGTANPWQIGDLNIKDLVLRYSILNPFSTSKITFYTFEASLEFFPNIFEGEFDLEITSDSSGNQLLINGNYEGEVSLNKLIEGISNGEVEVPNELIDISFSNFGVNLIQKDRGYDYRLYGNSDISFALPILGGNLESDLQVYIQNFDNQKNYYLRGGLSIGDSYFTTQIDINRDKKVVSGLWEALNQNYLQIDDLLPSLGLSIPNIPKDLDLGLKSASLAYDLKKYNSCLTSKIS